MKSNNNFDSVYVVLDNLANKYNMLFAYASLKQDSNYCEFEIYIEKDKHNIKDELLNSLTNIKNINYINISETITRVHPPLNITRRQYLVVSI